MVMPTPGVPGITTPSPAMVDMPVGKTCTNATFRGLALPAVNAARHSSLEDEAKPRGNYQHATDRANRSIFAVFEYRESVAAAGEKQGAKCNANTG